MATETNRDALLRAIDNADENTLRTVLKSMCQDSEVCRKEAIGRMVVSRKREVIELSDSSDNDTQNKPNKKKKTVELTQKSRFEKCETCEKTYDVTLNNNKACQTHDDLLEIDPDYFPDDDQVEYDIHSIDVETDWRREVVPEGFRWQCCDAPLNGKPCLVQWHISKNE
ncbi:hypothetical protein E0Z10_g5907 [Xylaria hypoxylon]|uniref:C2H2-type domain-containing protein n=1 Tax=Xylaria hypoxylon TaxID=37992 RepID=A0A4Z0YUQ9_9PEZI|nr:hypothetical protein E0Z10_g5907 [Xylaria hypoxylon]